MEKLLIGRKAEQRILNTVFNSNKSEFVAVYGRRRIGKTYLVEQFFTAKQCLYFQITGVHNGLLEEQLDNFSVAFSNTFFKDLDAKLESPSSWMQAFKLLTKTILKLSSRKKIVLFFDELPWLASMKSGFKKALDYYWNTQWSRTDNIILVVCGSAASWMINNIINDKGGLHNRITVTLPIYPFSLRESFDYLNYLGNKFNQQQVVELYMALGGVPHYLSQVKPNLSATQNIANLCFLRTSQLFKEFEKLFASLFNKADAYVELIKIIAKKRTGINRKQLETMAKLSSAGGTLTSRLTALEQAGFIKSFVPLGYTERGLHYKLIDEYCLFYLTWIHPIWRQIENEVAPNYWPAKHNSPAWRSWSGYAFEAICLKHVTQIRKALSVPPGTLSGSWSVTAKANAEIKTDGAQIDLLFDRDDNVINLCEIKYCQQPFEINKKYAADLERKVAIFKEQTQTSKQIFISLITAAPLKKNSLATSLIISHATLSDLFSNP